MRNVESWKGESMWSEQRRVYLTLTEREFVAQGVNNPSGEVVFQARGQLEQLGRFSEQMAREGAVVVVGRPQHQAGAVPRPLNNGELPDLPLGGNAAGDVPPPPGPKGGDKGELQTR